MDEKKVTIIMTKHEADECLKALIFRADTLTEKVKEAGQRGKVDQVIQLSEAIKTMQNTMNTLTNAGATIGTF